MPKSRRPANYAKRAARAKAGRKVSNQTIAIAAIALVAVIAIVVIVLVSQKPGASTAGSVTPTRLSDSSQIPALVGTKQYASAPPMTIDKTKQYFATVKMAKGGEFVIQLYPDKAPITVNSFVFLANQGYFNGTTFHRVLSGFMAQGGDPPGTGGGGPGYEFVNENSDLKFDKAGVVAMANSGPNTNGSQFFITFAPYEYGNGNYTIFGQVISGMDVVNNIRLRDPQQNPTYTGDAMESITITVK